MRSPFRCLSSTERESGLVLPPEYRDSEPRETDWVNFKFDPGRTEFDVRTLQSCLIWRMAIDWELELHISEHDRPSDKIYSLFETNCGDLGRSLCDRNDSGTDDTYLSEWYFQPGAFIGIPKNLLELFMFSVRQAEQYPTKRISHCRNAMMLIRLVLDSSILIELMAPDTIFGKKLKAKCADLHQKNFPWLLSPSRISVDESVKARATDIYDNDGPEGRWKESELLLRECMRPCAALMDPNLIPSTLCEVNMSYLEPDAHVGRLPGFTSRTRREYLNLLPVAVVCGPVVWQNTDVHAATGRPKWDPEIQKSSRQAIRETATAVYRWVRRNLPLAHESTNEL